MSDKRRQHTFHKALLEWCLFGVLHILKPPSRFLPAFELSATEVNVQPIAAPVDPMRTRTAFEARSAHDEWRVLHAFRTNGLDAEDMRYLRQSYEEMRRDGAIGDWLLDTAWSEHCVTADTAPPKSSATSSRKRTHNGAQGLYLFREPSSYCLFT